MRENEPKVAIRPIRSEEDYQEMASLIDTLVDSLPGTPEYDALLVASDLVWFWEKANHEILPPKPVDAIRFRLEQQGLKESDLVALLGSEALVASVMSGARPLTLAMIRKLHRHLGIPYESLIVEPRPARPSNNTFFWA